MSSPGDPESPPRDVPTPEPDTEDVESAPDGADDDVESDPGKGADDRADWADEGGATGEGPATDPNAS